MDDSTEVIARLRAAGCVFAEDESALLLSESATGRDLEQMVQQRVSGMPLEHVVGWARFAGLQVTVAEGVFVPRPRTKKVVDRAIAEGKRGGTVLELCCGTGAVGLAIARGLDATLWAADIDAAAVACARTNLDAERVFRSDLYDALPPGLTADLIVVIAPYVPTAEIGLLPREARDFEPLLALDGGDDGLSVVRRAVAGASARLNAGGMFITEVARQQAPAVVELLTAAGFDARAHGIVVTGMLV